MRNTPKTEKELAQELRDVYRQLTELEHVEAALREREKRFSDIAENASEWIWEITADGKYTYSSPVVKKILGYEPEEILKKHFYDLFHPEQREELKKAAFAAFAQKQPFREFINPNVHKNGETVWLSTSGIPIIDKEGNLLGYRGSDTDITERKESEQLFQALLRNAQFGTFLVQDNRFQIVNPQIQQHTGLSEAQLLSMNPIDNIHPDDRAEVRQNIIQMLKGQRSEPYEFRIVHKSGEYRTVMEVVTPVMYRGRKAILANSMDITERKKTEQAVRESEEKFRNLFEHAQDAVFLTDAETGTLTDVNPAGCAMLGRPKDQIIGQPMTVLHPPEMADKFQKIFQENVQKGVVPSDDSIIQRADGTRIQASVSASVIKLGDRTISQGVFRDITEQRRMEEKLRQSEEFSTSLLENAPNPIEVVNLDSSTRYVNKAFEELTGFTSAEVVGRKPSYPWVPDEVKKGTVDVIEKDLVDFENKAKEDASITRKEVLFQNKKGERLWADLSITAVKHDGKTAYLLINWVDITERKRMDEALRRSEENFRRSLDDSPLGIRIVDTYGEIIYLNRALLDIYGYSSLEEFRSIPTEKRLTPESYQEYKMHHEKLARGESVPEKWDVSIVRKDGEIRHFENLRKEILWNGEKQYQVLSQDITERKKAEKKLKQALADLEQSGARLAVVNKELEAFSYSVSHDLRSPLRSIDGFSQALLEDYADKLDATAQDYLRRLRSASQKMGELIDGLLKLSRLSRGEMHREKVDLSALAEEIANRLRETSPERKVEFIISGGLAVYGNPQFLRVLLENLLGNAWKFTGKVPLARIEFGAIPDSAPKTFFVKDNGAGFDMTYVDKLFGAFQRLHNATEFPGTGIGLATVQRIINRHGGTVRAEGEVGKGATFYFTLE